MHEVTLPNSQQSIKSIFAHNIIIITHNLTSYMFNLQQMQPIIQLWLLVRQIIIFHMYQCYHIPNNELRV